MSSNEEVEGKLDAVSAALRSMEQSIAALSGGLARALILIREEVDGQNQASGRIEQKVNDVHDLVNSTYTALLNAHKAALQQLVEYIEADLTASPNAALVIKRDLTAKQLKQVTLIIEGRDDHGG